MAFFFFLSGINKERKNYKGMYPRQDFSEKCKAIYSDLLQALKSWLFCTGNLNFSLTLVIQSVSIRGEMLN